MRPHTAQGDHEQEATGRDKRVHTAARIKRPRKRVMIMFLVLEIRRSEQVFTANSAAKHAQPPVTLDQEALDQDSHNGGGNEV